MTARIPSPVIVSARSRSSFRSVTRVTSFWVPPALVDIVSVMVKSPAKARTKINDPITEPLLPAKTSHRNHATCAIARGRSERGLQEPNTRTQPRPRSEEHTSELQSQSNLVCRLLLEKKK